MLQQRPQLIRRVNDRISPFKIGRGQRARQGDDPAGACPLCGTDAVRGVFNDQGLPRGHAQARACGSVRLRVGFAAADLVSRDDGMKASEDRRRDDAPHFTVRRPGDQPDPQAPVSKL